MGQQMQNSHTWLQNLQILCTNVDVERIVIAHKRKVSNFVDDFGFCRRWGSRFKTDIYGCKICRFCALMLMWSGYWALRNARLALSLTILAFVDDGAADSKLTYMAAKSADSVH